MRGNKFLALVVSFLVAAAVLAKGTQESKMASTAKSAGGAKAPVIWPAADIKWVEISPDTPGVKIADLWGDHTKGAFGALIKFPAGFSAPLHTHTHDFRIVVVSGTFIHGPEGKPEVSLGAGSYVLQPGNYRHTTKCGAASECVIFSEGKGAFDLIPVDAAKK
jgi:quercetin dioxygenase-like cupin family protein